MHLVFLPQVSTEKKLSKLVNISRFGPTHEVSGVVTLIRSSLTDDDGQKPTAISPPIDSGYQMKGKYKQHENDDWKKPNNLG